MIERQSISGRDASVAYLGPDFQPADKASYRYAKVLFDDGEMLILSSPNGDAIDEGKAEAVAWNRHRAGQTPKPSTRVMGRLFSQWAMYFIKTDAARIDNAIRIGLMGGLGTPEIARKVIGSADFNGVDGVTEITRQHIAQLGRAANKPSNPRK